MFWTFLHFVGLERSLTRTDEATWMRSKTFEEKPRSPDTITSKQDNIIGRIFNIFAWPNFTLL